MKTLEEHKAFPYIAWATVIVFAIFTYSLTMRLIETGETVNQYRLQQYDNNNAHSSAANTQ